MKLKVNVNGTDYDVVVDVEPEPTPSMANFLLSAAMPSAGAEPLAPAHARAPANEEKVLRAPISGTVMRVNVEAGQEVQTGDTLLVLEAMKMETEITAPVAGTISAVAVDKGEAVSGGQVLVEFQ
jgi:methylmalonyl-CoA carboxyltransferase small subunit